MVTVLAIAIVLAIIFVVPIIIYGAASASGWVKLPEDSSPQRFLLGVSVTKLGTAIALVMILQLTADVWSGRLWLYAALWFLMFAASEIGDAVAGRSTSAEALLGIASEVVYVPAAVFAAAAILGIG